MKFLLKYSTRSGVSDTAPETRITGILGFIRYFVRELAVGESVTFTLLRKQ